MTNKECAAIIRAAAKKWLDNVKDPDVRRDVEFANCYRADAKDMREVAKLVRIGKVKEAAMKADNLDTIVRELFPDNCWEYLMSALVK
jgi:hypothetical protein